MCFLLTMGYLEVLTSVGVGQRWALGARGGG